MSDKHSVETTSDHTIDDYIQRFWELQEEARAHGILSCVVLFENDELLRREAKALNYKGSPLVNLGMIEWAGMRLRDHLRTSERR